MKRTVYEAPLTERFQVELEGAMMSASVIDDSGQGTDANAGSQSYEEVTDDAWNKDADSFWS